MKAACIITCGGVPGPVAMNGDAMRCRPQSD